MAVTVTQKTYTLTADPVNRVYNCTVEVPTKDGAAYDDTQIRIDFAAGDSETLAAAKTYADEIPVTDTISFAISATTGDLVAGDVDSFHAPYNFTLSTFWVGVNTAPTGSALVADVKKAGVSCTSSKAIIDATEFTSLTGTAPVLTTTTFLKGDLITPVISQVGSLETGKSLKLYLEIIKN